jgi:hypothetical protein
MSLDYIWNQIKEDDTEIYGMSMLDAFLMLTKELDSEHYEELTPQQKQKISGDAAFSLLTLAMINDNSGVLFAKRAKEMGSEATDRMSSSQIVVLLKDMIANTKSLDGAQYLNLEKLKPSGSSYHFTDNVEPLLNAAKNPSNSDNSTKLLEQLLSLLRKYNLLDPKNQEELVSQTPSIVYFLARPSVPIELFKDELKNMNSNDFAELIIYSISMWNGVSDRQWQNILLNKIKVIKEVAGGELKNMLRVEPAIKEKIKIELARKSTPTKSIVYWDEIEEAIG